jgi:NADH dehydrogenase (ubiquinone) Fe-S protein 1
MIPVYINNNFVLVSQTSSVLEACETVGIIVPRFCYHSQLPIAGNCRMCLVEVEKSPKPVASCAMPVTKNMRIFTDTPLVKKAREGVLEFLLLNHPLDCPICDQGGECDLQDQALTFGSDKSRFFEFKRGVVDKNLGSLVKTIMTRCIHCTRCVRFAAEIAGVGILGTTNRGKDTEIGLYVGELVMSELSGNLIDVCPVGALTSKPYAFSARPWELRSTETLDFLDSVGSNIVVDLKETEILRVQPKQNDLVNRVWLSDRGRFAFDGYKNQRLNLPFFQKQKSIFVPLRWKEVNFVFKNVCRFLVLKQGLVNLKFSTALEIIGVGQLFSRFAVICTNTMSIGDLFTIKQSCAKFGIKTVGHSGSDAPTNHLDSDVFFGCNFKNSDLPKTEFCVLVGTNPRFEAAVFNVQLRKRFTFGLFKTVSIGIPHTPTFSTTFTGISTSLLLKIVEGNSSLCKEFTSKTSVVIVGSSLFKRVDYSLSNVILTALKNVINVGVETQLSTGFLNREVNSLGGALCGFNHIANEQLSESVIAYLIGDDHNFTVLSLLLDDPYKLIIYQGAHNQLITNHSDLVLVSTSLFENSGLFISFEGRIQRANIVSKSLGEAKTHNKICSVFCLSYLSVLLKVLPNSFLTFSLLNTTDLQTVDLFLPAVVDLNKTQKMFVGFNAIYYIHKQRFVRAPFIACIFDFHLVNVVTRASKLMVKCSQTQRLNHKNFISL